MASFLSGGMGEPGENDDACERCRERMGEYGVAPFFCSVDGSVEAIGECFTEAKARRARKVEDWVLA